MGVTTNPTGEWVAPGGSLRRAHRRQSWPRATLGAAAQQLSQALDRLLLAAKRAGVTKRDTASSAAYGYTSATPAAHPATAGRPVASALAVGASRHRATLQHTARLPPLRGHCDELRKLDTATPETLLREDPDDLAPELKVTVARVRRWRSLAEPAMLRSRRDGQRLPVATVSLLQAAGVDSVDALREALQQGDAFRDRLRKEINDPRPR